MNERAMTHVRKAGKLLARGEDFYRQAAAEMRAAKDEGATWPEIGEALGHGGDWARRIVKWAENPANERDTWTPHTYEGHRAGSDRAATKRILREAPSEDVERIVGELPPEAVEKVAKAVSRSYERRGQERKAKAERDFEEAVGSDVAARLTDEQRLHDAETRAFEARRALRDLLALLNEADLSAMRDSWREDLLKTLDDVGARLDMARALLTGTLDEDLDRFLAEVER